MSRRSSNILDPFCVDIFDPFDDYFPFTGSEIASGRGGGGAQRSGGGVVYPRIDWRETGEEHIFKVDLPGVKKEDVNVEVEDGRLLQFSGERRSRSEGEEKGGKWHRSERGGGGKFTRRFKLPKNARMDQVKASMEDGVLTVIVPKKDATKPELKSVQIA